MTFKTTSLALLPKQRTIFRTLLGLVALVVVSACSSPAPTPPATPTPTSIGLQYQV